MQQMQIGGDELRGSLINPFYLEEMENKVTHFKHRDNRELAFKNLGIEALALYQAYPNRSIFDHINPDLLCPEENDRVSAGQYVSFYWSSEDCFNDTLTDMVNNEFQEMGEQEEPTSVQIFSEPQEKETHDFDFETRLFSFINRLIELLNDYDHEEPE
jgi:hypothetical protein